MGFLCLLRGVILKNTGLTGSKQLISGILYIIFLEDFSVCKSILVVHGETSVGMAIPVGG